VEPLEAREVPAFLAPTDYGTRVGDAVVVADFNGDGKLDHATVAKIGKNSQAIAVQLSNGLGGFGNSKHTTLPTAPQDMAAADLNGDGKLDLVTTQGGNVTVLLGKGTGLFQTPKNFALTNANGYSLAIADFDGDGKLDVAVTGLRIAPGGATMNGVIDVFKGDGKGSLAVTQSYNLPSAPNYDWMGTESPNWTMTAVGDFNGDHRPDLAVAVPRYPTGNGSVFILTNVGGSLAAPSEIGLSAGAMLAVGDMNDDGRADLVTRAGVSLGNGDGTFQPPILSELATLTDYEDAIILADLNGDGKLDVAANTRYFLGNGDGTVQAFVQFASWPYNGAYGGVAMGDFNGDGRPDLVGLTGAWGAFQLRIALNDGNW
jgi:hypothetical protein